MKKYYKGLCLIFLIIFIITISYFTTKSRTTYTIPSNICQAIFGCEPEHFFDMELDYYTRDNDFRKHAKLDKDGNLILRLNDKQKDVLKNKKNWGFGIEELKSRENIKISADYSKITIYCYAETVSDDLSCLAFGVSSLAVEQLLNNQDPATISVEIILKDAVTNETVYFVSWPSETFNFGSKDYSFSEKNDSHLQSEEIK